MVKKINGQLACYYLCPSTKTKIKKTCPMRRYGRKNRYLISLLGILMGIFLFPNIAYLSSVTAEKIIELTNEEREISGINILTANQLLTKAALKKANTIFKTQKFQHNINGKKFSSWIKDAGYEYSYVGENLAIDFITSEGIIKAWKNSELHRKNLLNPRFTEIGIAALEGNFKGNNATLVVQIFGELNQASARKQISDVNLNYQPARIIPSEQKNIAAPANIIKENSPAITSKQKDESAIALSIISPRFISDRNELILKHNRIKILSEMPQLTINKLSEQLIYRKQILNLTLIILIIISVPLTFYIYVFYRRNILKLFNGKIYWKNLIPPMKHFNKIHPLFQIYPRREVK